MKFLKVILIPLIALVLCNDIISQVSQSIHVHWFKNNFPDGQLIISNTTLTQIGTSPIDFTINPEDNTTYYASAINYQINNGYNMLFNNWNLNGSFRSNNITISFT